MKKKKSLILDHVRMSSWEESNVCVKKGVLCSQLFLQGLLTTFVNTYHLLLQCWLAKNLPSKNSDTNMILLSSFHQLKVII